MATTPTVRGMQLHGRTLPIFPPQPADPALRPADALLRESTANQSQYSPATQYEQITAAMARHGYYPSCIDGDEQRGRVVSRPGYQPIKARVQAGLTEAVFVFHSSRLGRDASERLALQRELKKLRVPIYSAQQGEIRADVIGGVYALMDEQFSVDLAYKIKNAMPSAVKNGLYPARTPVGYKRIWPEGQAYDRKSRPEMVPDEHYGPLVQDIFKKYGCEGCSIRAIVRWLNTQVATHPNPGSETGLWNMEHIARMLGMTVYIGVVTWGVRKSGYYDHYEGAILRSGEGDCGPARHPALITPELWEAVQMRRANDDPRRQTATRRGRTPGVLSGFLACNGCGGPMRLCRKEPHARNLYACLGRERGQSPCREPACSQALADAAVLRVVARLRPGRPWTPDALDEVAAHDPHASQRAALETQITAARRELDVHIQVLKATAQAGPLAEATLQAFRRDQQELDQRITALGEQLTALPRSSVDPITLPALYARLATTDLAGLIASAQGDGDVAALRQLLQATIQQARIVERRGGGGNGRTGWMKARVKRTPAVELFLAHGYLLLDPPAPAPVPPAALSGAQRTRAWRAKHPTQRPAQPAVPEGLLTVPQAAAALGVAVPAIHSALRRQTLGAVRVEAWPQRVFIARQEIERYRAERLGKPGRRRQAEAGTPALY